MDGSGAFLLDPPFLSAGLRPASGILYIEDFDAEPDRPGPADAPASSEPTYGPAELEAAREAGRQEGLAAALHEASLVQAQLHAAALQSVADGLSAARGALDAVAVTHAETLSRTILAVLQAAVPATMRAQAGTELRALLDCLRAGLACEPELRVRTHPDLADTVREHLAAGLPEEACVLAICADPAMQPGDVQIAWQDGRFVRDTGAVWAAITAALAPLNLPTREELCRDTGS